VQIAATAAVLLDYVSYPRQNAATVGGGSSDYYIYVGCVASEMTVAWAASAAAEESAIC
jgi:hypothetical protein